MLHDVLVMHTQNSTFGVRRPGIPCCVAVFPVISKQSAHKHAHKFQFEAQCSFNPTQPQKHKNKSCSLSSQKNRYVAEAFLQGMFCQMECELK